ADDGGAEASSGQEPGRKGSAANAGDRAGAGGRRPQERGADLGYGPADTARLGAPLQRRGAGGARVPAGRRTGASGLACADGGTRRMGGGRPRPGGRRRGPLAAAGSARPDRGALHVEMHERTVGKYLTAHGYRRLSVRPRHPKTDPEAQETFKKRSPRR